MLFVILHISSSTSSQPVLIVIPSAGSEYIARLSYPEAFSVFPTTQNVHYDAEIFGQWVTAFLSMRVTTEEELKKFYFTTFGARLAVEQTTKKRKPIEQTTNKKTGQRSPPP